MSKEKMLFNYRTSILKEQNNKYFLIEVIFDLSTKVEKYSSNIDNIDFRENKQPKGNTCGSFFKNPKINIDTFWINFPELYNKNLKTISAGFLIESAKLK
jgi:UDP-N-acetylenolpyruvoylglucosamine reductase